MTALNGGHVPPRSGSYSSNHSNMNGLSNGPSSDFEVISQPGSATSFQAGGGQASDLTHIAPLISTAMPSMTEVTLNQALQKIQELSKENSELRDFLRENNEVMKKQFVTLTDYKQKVSEANKYNKEKFEQTKTLVLSLRADNERLQGEVLALQHNDERETLKTKIKDLEMSNKALSDHRTLGDTLVTDLQKEVDTLKEKLARETAEKAEMILVSKADLPEDEEMGKLLENDRLESTVQENRMLQEENSRLMKDVRQFKSTADQLLADLESTQALKSERERECQGLGEENARLSSKVQQTLKDVCNIRDRNDALVLEIQNLQSQLAQRNSEPDRAAAGDTSFVYVAPSNNPATMAGATCTSSSQTTESMVGPTETRDEPDENRLQSTTIKDVLSQLQTERETTATLRASLAEKNQQLQKLRSDLQVKEQVFLQNTTRIESSSEEVTAGQAKVIADIQATTDKLGRQSELRDQEKESQCISYEDVHSLKYQVMTLINEVHESQTKLKAASDAVDSKNKRITEMESQNSTLNGKLERQRSQDDALIDSMRIALMNQEEALAAERVEHQRTRKQLADIRGSFNQLVTDYKDLLDTFDQYRLSQEKSPGNTVPLNKHKAEVDQLMAQVIGAEEAIAYRDTQIFDLKKELHKMRQEVEKIPVLKAQADVYKSDFDAERKAREKQHDEKDVIIQDMNNLQIQNQQLLDELESYSRNQIVEMQHRHSSNPYAVVPPRHPTDSQHTYRMVPTAPSTQPQALSQGPGQWGYPYPGPAEGDWGTSDPAHGQPGSRSSDMSQPDELYGVPSCPKCGLQCPDLDTLQIHVIECLDQDLLSNN